MSPRLLSVEGLGGKLSLGRRGSIDDRRRETASYSYWDVWIEQRDRYYKLVRRPSRLGTCNNVAGLNRGGDVKVTSRFATL